MGRVYETLQDVRIKYKNYLKQHPEQSTVPKQPPSWQEFMKPCEDVQRKNTISIQPQKYFNIKSPYCGKPLPYANTKPCYNTINFSNILPSSKNKLNLLCYPLYRRSQTPNYGTAHQ